MAAKTGWHRYGTKLRYCQPMYTRSRTKVRNTDGVIRLCRTFDDVVAVAFCGYEIFYEDFCGLQK